ncbi:hypothetical protein HOY80DRAFT_1091947 [Tuber brumale]|nr:hypothetical protein HOY80DRAFT_1091947 [Tuber brumale]
MINIKKIAYLLSIAAITVDGVWGRLEEVAHSYPGSANPAGSANKRAQSEFCRIWEHSSVYHDGAIYVDRTLATFTVGPVGSIALRTPPPAPAPSPPSSQANSSKLQPWSLHLTSDFTAEGIDSGSPILRSLTVSQNGTVYKYGGYYPPEGLWRPNSNDSSFAPRNAEIWELNTKTRNWTKTAQPSGGEFWGARGGGFTSIPSHDMAFFLGGWSSNMTDGRLQSWTHGEILAHQSMLQWDVKSNKMYNKTTSFQAIILSNLVHVPVGKFGVLLSLGGIQFTGFRFNGTESNMGLKPRGFDSVDVYDFETDSWYIQPTTGEIPSNRHSFCTVVGTAADNSSFNIFMHGGASPALDAGFSDTYVLSVPAFQWFRVDTANKVQRYGATCHLVKNKMILIGGRGVDQLNPNLDIPMPLPGACDPNGIVNIFDVNALKWDSNFQVSKLENFKVNKKITGDVGIGGGPNGGATKIEPEGGWGSSQLREIFAKGVPVPPPPQNITPPITTPIISPATTSPSQNPSTTGAAPGPATVQGGLFLLGVSLMVVLMSL